MPAHSIKTIQKIPASLQAVWGFFSNAANLEDITPADMGFKVISENHGNKIYAGQIIEYTVKPVLNFPIYWMTKITYVKEGEYFVDEQRFGPYTFWHHQHHFKAIEGGVEMTDIVHYKIPLWVLGRIMNSFLVRKKVEKIFEYRFKKVEELFGQWPGSQEARVLMH